VPSALPMLPSRSLLPRCAGLQRPHQASVSTSQQGEGLAQSPLSSLAVPLPAFL